jgi:hypothetical protein
MLYHPTKANVVADETIPKELIDQLPQQFAIMQIDKVLTGGSPIVAALVVQPLSLDRIRHA